MVAFVKGRKKYEDEIDQEANAESVVDAEPHQDETSGQSPATIALSPGSPAYFVRPLSLATATLFVFHSRLLSALHHTP